MDASAQVGNSESATAEAGRLLLYDAPLSGNCYKVRLLLAHLGLDYERRDIDVIDRSTRAEALGPLNPALRIPVLVLGDGRVLAESNAILWYLAQGTDFTLPDSFAQAKILQWMFFEQYSLEPHIGLLRYVISILHQPLPQELAFRRKAGEKSLKALDAVLSECTFLVGERFTIADIALYAYTHIAEEAEFQLAQYPAICAWLERVAAQPGHISITD